MAIFAVCYRPASIGFGTYVFSLGSITPESGNMAISMDPISIRVFMDRVDGILFKYTIYVDCRPQPFGGMPPYPAHYRFYDESGDSYFLECLTASLHEVSFNSEAPNIVQVEIAGQAGIGDYWANAPTCPFSESETDRECGDAAPRPE